MTIDGNAALRVELDADGGEVELVRVRASAGGDQQLVDADLVDVAVGSRELDRHVRAATLHGANRCAELELDARIPERLLDERARARILLRKHARLAFDEHDLDPEPREGLREL